MTDDELRAIIAAEITHCDNNSGEEADDRALALQYYLGDPDAGQLAQRGEGRSAVVSTDVRDTIESAMPSLMRIFSASDKVVAFEPVGVEDIPAAEQETAVCNHVVMKQNRGFERIYFMTKDALLSRRGIVKVTWEETDRTERESYEGLTDEEYQSLIADDGVEEVDHTERKRPPEGIGGLIFPFWTPTEHDVTIKRTETNGKCRIDNVPPEDFLISSRARDDVTASFLGDRSKKTVTELLEMGFKREDIDKVPAWDGDSDNSSESQARKTGTSGFDGQTNALDDSTEEKMIIECHLMVDFDGDGRAERRKVIVGGTTAEVIFLNEEEDDHPYATICPLPMPHRAGGLSLADLAAESQLVNTVILRNTLDNFYLTNNSRMEVAEQGIGDNTIDDLLTVRPGGIVRTAQPGHLNPLVVPSVLAPALSMLEYMNTLRENRTGITRYNQGLDADTLNKTATGVSLIQNAAMQRLELIARTFAETGIKRMFLLVHDLLRKHSEKVIPFRLRGQWVEVDPRKWARRMDLTANVGLGTGNSQQQLAAIDGLLAIQQQVAQAQGGMNGPVVTWKHVFNALEKRVAVGEIGAPDQYFADPENAPPQPPPPNPEIELKKAELEMEGAKMQQKAQIDQQTAQANLAMKAQEAQQEMMLAERKAQHEMKLAEMRLQHEMRLAQLKADADIAVKTRTAELTAAAQADATRAKATQSAAATEN